MLAFLDEHRSPKGVDASDPRFKTRKALQLGGNAKINERQRPVLPEGSGCALWSFQVPWGPFEYYLSNPCTETKPFLWTNSFHVGHTEWMMFFGIEPMEAEGRSSLWMAVCNNLASPVTAYTKLDVLIPTNAADCGELMHVGDAVDSLNSCGQVFQKNKFGRFWWHKTPSDFHKCLFRGTGDAEHERSFEVLLTVSLNLRSSQERAPAREEDPKLWEVSCKYLQPWVQARAAGVVEPFENRIKGLQLDIQQERDRAHQAMQQQESDAKARLRAKDEEIEAAVAREREAVQREQAAIKREEAAVAKASKLETKLNESMLREEQLKKHSAALEQRLKEAAAREKQLRYTIESLEEKLKAAAQREAELRQWGQQLQNLLSEAKEREDKLVKEKGQLEDYIKNTAIREERLQNAIRDLEGKLKSGKLMEQHLTNTIAKMQYNVADYREREELLRASNGQLYMAATDEKVRTQALSTSPHNPSSPPRMRALAGPGPVPPPHSPGSPTPH